MISSKDRTFNFLLHIFGVLACIGLIRGMYILAEGHENGNAFASTGSLVAVSFTDMIIKYKTKSPVGYVEFRQRLEEKIKERFLSLGFKRASASFEDKTLSRLPFLYVSGEAISLIFYSRDMTISEDALVWYIASRLHATRKAFW